MDIIGLTSYEPGRLPGWYRDRVYDDPIDDAALFDESLGQLNAVGWGTAVIDGEEVLLWHVEEIEWFTEHFEFANVYGLGVTFVEPSQDFWEGTTAYYSQSRFQKTPPGKRKTRGGRGKRHVGLVTCESYLRPTDGFAFDHQFAESLDCEMVVSESSFWYPGKTLRLAFMPRGRFFRRSEKMSYW